MMAEPAIRPRFEDLATRESRLLELRRVAEIAGSQQRRDDDGFCANAVWYGYPRKGSSYGEGSIRGQIIALVGRHSQHADPLMHTSAAYEVVSDTLWDLLPNCDHEDRSCGWGASVQDND